MKKIREFLGSVLDKKLLSLVDDDKLEKEIIIPILMQHYSEGETSVASSTVVKEKEKIDVVLKDVKVKRDAYGDTVAVVGTVSKNNFKYGARVGDKFTVTDLAKICRFENGDVAIKTKSGKVYLAEGGVDEETKSFSLSPNMMRFNRIYSIGSAIFNSVKYDIIKDANSSGFEIQEDIDNNLTYIAFREGLAAISESRLKMYGGKRVK